MATVNRYTNIQPAKYTPRTLQEMMVAPSYMRGQHDKLDEGRAELETALAQTDPLAVHGDVAQAEQQKLYDQMSQQAEQLASKGFTPTSKSDFIRLNKQYQQAVSPTGTLGKINAAKTAMEAQKNAYIENMTKAGYDPEAVGLNWDEYAQQYGEEFAKTGTVKNIDPKYGPNYFNVVDELEQRLTKAGLTSEQKANLNSYIQQDAQGTYVLNIGKDEMTESNKNQLKAAVDWINNQVNNPKSEIGRSLKEQRITAQDALNQVAGLSDIYLKSAEAEKNTSTITNYSPNKEAGIQLPGSTQYEAEEAENINTQVKTLSDTLSDIVGEVLYTPPDEKGGESTGSYLRSKGIEKQPQKSTLENRLDKEQLDKYKDIYERFQNSNADLAKVPYNDPKAIKAMQTYFENNKSILRQNHIITDDFIVDYGDSSVGVKGTDATKIAGAIKANPTARRYSINGKTMSYDELPSDVKANFQSPSVKYSGYYSPKNFMTRDYGKLQDKKLFVSPLKMNYVDDNGNITKILVSRSDAEMKNPAFIADTIFNDIFVETNSLPSIPYNVPELKAEIVYMPGVMGGSPHYVINQRDEDGVYKTPIKLSESQLQSELYRKFGVPQKKSSK